MKRFLAIFLSVLLILPVICIPCFAATGEYRFFFDGQAGTSDNGNVLTRYRGAFELPEGTYSLNAFADTGTGNMLVLESEPFIISYTPFGSFGSDFYISEIDVICMMVDSVGNIVASASVPLSIFYDSVLAETLVIVPFYDDSNMTLIFTPEEKTEALIDQVKLLSRSYLDTVNQIVSFIVSNPLLLVTVGIFFVGGCIGIFGRLLKVLTR